MFTLEIGLDGIYRKTNLNPVHTVLCRGFWEEDRTFTTTILFFGMLLEVELTFHFSDSTVELTVLDAMEQGVYAAELTGRMADE